MFDPLRFTERAHQLMHLGAELAARGWVPATSGNLSARIVPGSEVIAITASGRDKAHLTEDDILAIDLHGRPLDSTARPSAETPLHALLYQRDPTIGAVLHTHSPHQTVASKLFSAVRLEGYELLKALDGQHSHEAALDVPVLPNDQDLTRLAHQVVQLLDSPNPPRYGYLIAGHGLYTWGRDVAYARRHLEALDFMLGCELELRRLRP